MRVSQGESVCPTAVPAPTLADGRVGGALHCGWRGWDAGEYAVFKSHLVLGVKRPIRFPSPGPALPTPSRGHSTRDAH